MSSKGRISSKNRRSSYTFSLNAIRDQHKNTGISSLPGSKNKEASQLRDN